jgi:ribose/xylose/arabinose/galactoside ABC-type transport system permease subunit
MKMRPLSQRENGPMLLTLIAVIATVFIVELIFVRNFEISKVAFIKPRNISNVMMQVSTTGILAISMTLVMVSGGIDLSIGQMMCFVGTGMALLMSTLGVNDVLVAVIGVVVAVGFQVLMGFIISRTKLEPFIVSLGFMTIYKGFTYLITNGSEITLGNHFSFLGSTYFNLSPTFRIGMPVLVLLILEIAMWLVLKYTKFGRAVYAVGGNESAAYLAGINVKRFKLLVYGLNGIFVAIGTMVLLSRLGTGNPLIGEGKEIDVIAAVVVGGTALSGGKGNVWGTLIGVLLLGCISNALNILGVNPYWQFVMTGSIIILAVLLSYFSGRSSESAKVGTRKGGTTKENKAVSG